MDGSIKVVSKRWTGTQANAGDIIIDADRTNKILGNPFVMRDKSLAERERVIAANNQRVDKDISQNGPISKELDKIVAYVIQGKDVALACWCAPAQCHCDRYKLEIEKKVSNLRADGHLNSVVSHLPSKKCRI